MSRVASARASTLALSTSFGAQAAPDADGKNEDKWGLVAPPGLATRKDQLSVDEGSWMNVDVAPDGRTIAFDLLGDIYTMPIEGGTPTRIAEGLAYEHQPRFSADGQRIAFVSDRSEEHTPELQSLMRNSYAVFFFNKKNQYITSSNTSL